MSLLDKLVKDTLKDIERGYYNLNLRVYHNNPKLSNTILNYKNVPIISEIKFASPLLGTIKEYTDPVKIAKDMISAGAIGISILTNSAFKGSLNYLINVRVAIDMPILMKDIIIDKIQIDAAYRSGADCILLIYSVFKDYYPNNLEEFIDYAHKNDLEVLLEVHDKDEFDKALMLNADMIGINNRDLRTMEIDINNTERILSNKVTNKIIISESGIDKPEDIRRLYKIGVKGFLIGTSIMRSNNIKDKLSELVRSV